MGFYPPPMSMPVEVKVAHADPRADGHQAIDELPEARLLDPEPTARQVRWTMRLVWFMLIVLALVCAIGPHIPTGE